MSQPMNPFINYQQRGVELPAGCKDLIDVIGLEQQRASQADRTRAEGLADIERYVSRLMDPRGRLRRLTISCHGRTVMCLGLSPFCKGHSPWLVSVAVFVDAAKPTEEQEVCRLFDDAGISPLIKSLVTGAGPARVLYYPLPCEPSAGFLIITQVLRKPFGVTAHTALWFDSCHW
jgi:hypothetical protein